MTAYGLGRLTSRALAQLYDTPAHAAVTALTVAQTLADPVHSHSVRVIFPLIGAAAAGDGSEARIRSAALSTLVADVLHTACEEPGPKAKLVLALERWLLHPQAHTADEVTRAAADFVADPSTEQETLEHAWLAGPGIDSAIEQVRRDGFEQPAAHISLIAAATRTVVPVVWVARELDVPRSVIYRHTRSVDHNRWRELLD